MDEQGQVKEEEKIVYTPSTNPLTKWICSKELLVTNDKIISENKHLPLIACCPDWRIMKDEETKEYLLDPVTGGKRYSFIQEIIDIWTKVINTAGARLIFISPEEKIEDISDKIDGFLISGGRDIDPEIYGQENTASVFDKEDSQMRMNQIKKFMEGMNKKMPVLAVCLGYQAINVVFGGTIEQDIAVPSDHKFKTRAFVPVEGTHLHRASKGQIINQTCFHHQNVLDIPECLKVSAYDQLDGSPHGLEWKDDSRVIMGILFHPEAGPPYSHDSDLEMSAQIFKYYVDLCVEYKNSKNNSLN